MTRLLRRALLSAIFLWTSIGVLQNAEHMTAPAEALGLPEPEQFVRLHGAVNLVGSLMLILGIKPKLAAWAIVANLIPTTVGGHRFWEQDDEGGKIEQTIHFLKNVSLLGGLLSLIATERARDDR